MSKILNITDGDYRINLKKPDGHIYLGAPTVTVQGDLYVEGDTTTINTANLAIEDRIIVLNNNEEGPGITGIPGTQKSGIEIQRGANTASAFLIYDEELTVEGQSIGAFSAYTSNGSTKTLAGLQTDLLFTDGSTNLRIATGGGTIRVLSANYTDQVADDNDIPNYKAVQDYVALYAGANPPTETVSGDTKFQAQDSDVVQGVTDSELNFIVDNVKKGYVQGSSAGLQDIVFQTNTITTANTGDDLILTASGTGNVKLTDGLHLDTLTETEPASPSTGTVVYYDQTNTKDTGIYYKNSNSKQGEIASRRSAVLFSLIF